MSQSISQSTNYCRAGREGWRHLAFNAAVYRPQAYLYHPPCICVSVCIAIPCPRSARTAFKARQQPFMLSRHGCRASSESEVAERRSLAIVAPLLFMGLSGYSGAFQRNPQSNCLFLSMAVRASLLVERGPDSRFHNQGSLQRTEPVDCSFASSNTEGLLR